MKIRSCSVSLYPARRAISLAYIATRPEADGLDAFYGGVVAGAGVKSVVPGLPVGIQAARRGDVVFMMNFSGAPATVTLPAGIDLVTGRTVGGEDALPVNGFRIVKVKR